MYWFVLTWNGVTSLNFLKATVTGCVCCQYDQHLHSHTWYCLLPNFDPFCRSLSFFSTPSYSVFHATASILIISVIPFFSFPILLFSLISPSFPPILLPLSHSPNFPLYFSLSLPLLISSYTSPSPSLSSFPPILLPLPHSPLQPGANPQLMKMLQDQGSTAFAMDCIPRLLSRGQTFDALSSQVRSYVHLSGHLSFHVARLAHMNVMSHGSMRVC